jgi:surface protein
MFQYCKYLTNLNLKKFNTQNVESTAGLFSHCGGLNEIDISNFDLRNNKDICQKRF